MSTETKDTSYINRNMSADTYATSSDSKSDYGRS